MMQHYPDNSYTNTGIVTRINKFAGLTLYVSLSISICLVICLMNSCAYSNIPKNIEFDGSIDCVIHDDTNSITEQDCIDSISNLARDISSEEEIPYENIVGCLDRPLIYIPPTQEELNSICSSTSPTASSGVTPTACVFERDTFRLVDDANYLMVIRSDIEPYTARNDVLRHEFLHMVLLCLTGDGDYNHLDEYWYYTE